MGRITVLVIITKIGHGLIALLESGKMKSGSNDSSYNTIIMRNKSN